MIAPLYAEVRKSRPHRGLGFMPGSFLGDYLGDISALEQAAAAESGLLNTAQVNTLIAAGASDSDVDAILNGVQTYDQVLQRLAGGSFQTGVTSSSGAAVTSAPQSPVGTTYTISVSWSLAGNLANFGVASNGSALINNLPALLRAQNFALVGSSVSEGVGSSTVTFKVEDMIGHAKIADATGVLQQITEQASGNANFSAFNVSLTQLGTGIIAADSGAAAPLDLTTWLETNAQWIGLGAVAIFILPAVIKKF